MKGLWFSKLKRFFVKEEQIEESEIVSFEQFFRKVRNSLDSRREKEGVLKMEIRDRISLFEKKMLDAVAALEKIDLSERKEHEKIKLIVTNNLEVYIIYMKKLVENLKNIQEVSAESYIHAIIRAVSDSNKNRRVPFEKATILIGKEIALTRDVLREFMQEIDKISGENEVFFKETAELHKIEKFVEAFKKNESYSQALQREMKVHTAKLEETKNLHNSVREEIIGVKESEDYKKDMEMKKLNSRRLDELEKSLQACRNKINFKLLAKNFHSDKKKNKLIRSYVENFASALKDDEKTELIELVKISQNVDVALLKEIRKKIIELENAPSYKTDERISLLQDDLMKMELSMGNIEGQIRETMRKKEKLDDKKSAIITSATEAALVVFPNLSVNRG